MTNNKIIYFDTFCDIIDKLKNNPESYQKNNKTNKIRRILHFQDFLQKSYQEKTRKPKKYQYRSSNRFRTEQRKKRDNRPTRK